MKDTFQAVIWWKSLRITWKPMSKIFFFPKKLVLIGLLRLGVSHRLIIKIPGIFSFWLASILRTLNKQLGTTLNRRGRICVLISSFTKVMFSDAFTHCSQKKSFSWEFQEYWSYTMNIRSNTDWFKTWFNAILPIPR